MPLSDPTLILNIWPSVQRVFGKKTAAVLFIETILLIISGTRISFMSLYRTSFNLGLLFNNNNKTDFANS